MNLQEIYNFEDAQIVRNKTNDNFAEFKKKNNLPGDVLTNNSVTTDQLANYAVTTQKLADGAVTTPKLADNAVTTPKITDKSVTAAKIADKSVTTAAIADGAITYLKNHSQWGWFQTQGRAVLNLQTKTFQITSDVYFMTDTKSTRLSAQTIDFSTQLASAMTQICYIRSDAAATTTDIRMANYNQTADPSIIILFMYFTNNIVYFAPNTIKLIDVNGNEVPTPVTLPNNVVGSNNIIDGSIQTVDLALGAVDYTRLAYSWGWLQSKHRVVLNAQAKTLQITADVYLQHGKASKRLTAQTINLSAVLPASVGIVCYVTSDSAATGPVINFKPQNQITDLSIIIIFTYFLGIVHSFSHDTVDYIDENGNISTNIITNPDSLLTNMGLILNPGRLTLNAQTKIISLSGDIYVMAGLKSIRISAGTWDVSSVIDSAMTKICYIKSSSASPTTELYFKNYNEITDTSIIILFVYWQNNIHFATPGTVDLINANGEKVFLTPIPDGSITKSMLSFDISAAEARNIYTLNDAWTSWMHGDKFPIAFYSDSTVDGNTTTGWIAGVVGQDNLSPNAFPAVLQEKMREATGNNILRIYNAGFSGRNAEFGYANMAGNFSGSAAYADVKMIGIGFGINDRLLYDNVRDYRIGYKGNMEKIINWCYDHNIQPFLLESQAQIQPGVTTGYIATYPLRTSMHVNVVANEVKRELGEKYKIPVLNFTEFTYLFLLYSSYTAKQISSDTQHFTDLGHKYASDVYFAFLNPQTIFAEGPCQLDYSSQNIAAGVPTDLLTIPDVLTDTFKSYANYAKGDMSDALIYKIYVFFKLKTAIHIKAYKSVPSSLTYVKINGTVTQLESNQTDLGIFEMGLYKIEVYTGNSNLVDFRGFIIE